MSLFRKRLQLKQNKREPDAFDKAFEEFKANARRHISKIVIYDELGQPITTIGVFKSIGFGDSINVKYSINVNYIAPVMIVEGGRDEYPKREGKE